MSRLVDDEGDFVHDDIEQRSSNRSIHINDDPRIQATQEQIDADKATQSLTSAITAFNDVRRVIAGVAAEVYVKYDVEGIRSRVFAMLDAQVQHIVLGSLGFEVDHFDRNWRINGRSSVAEHWVDATAKKAAEDWLATNIGRLPTLPESAIKDLRSAFLRTLTHRLRELVIKKAEIDANTLADEVSADVRDQILGLRTETSNKKKETT